MIKLLRTLRRYEAVCIFLIVSLLIGIHPPTMHAQSEEITAFGHPATIVYTTDHPLDPTMLIMASTDGRYPISPLEGCDWVGSSDQMLLYYDDAGEPYLFEPHLSPNDTAPVYNCHIQIHALIDSTPCFQNYLGNCDVYMEVNQ